ncbi:MAG TPA: enolase C-terminal domain-like protein [Gammaproteobacteria bacterium]|nr:enolase C-terminal domain-like protein [Gammaproteobacteria bacterium]
MNARLSQIVLRRLRLPLITPYRLRYGTFEEFEPILIEVLDDSGRSGFGEAHISPGSSRETRAGGWAFARRLAKVLCGMPPAEARALVEAEFHASPVAATALTTAIEMLEGHPLLVIPEDARLPLISPVNGLNRREIETEISDKLGKGFRTFKVKVGKDVQADLDRLATIQTAVSGRATLRVDANRGFNRRDAEHFATRMDPTGVELFEQPCAAEDWESNAAVARASTVPLMLDEPICGVDDIERAARIDGVGYVKLKLKRFGGLTRLRAALERARDTGLEPVLGDGLGSEPMCWMEACVARSTIGNAGEFNGYLKPSERMFRVPLGFEGGNLVLTAGPRPELDPQQLAKLTLECVRWQ